MTVRKSRISYNPKTNGWCNAQYRIIEYKNRKPKARYEDDPHGWYYNGPTIYVKLVENTGFENEFYVELSGSSAPSFARKIYAVNPKDAQIRAIEIALEKVTSAKEQLEKALLETKGELK